MTTNIPRVTGGPNDPGVLYDNGLIVGSEWYQTKHQRRGRLVHHAAHLIAKGFEIEDSWWGRHSGEGDADRVDHEECRPYLEGVRNALAEQDIRVAQVELEVHNRHDRYLGHLDWLAEIQGKDECIIDLKCGQPAKWHGIQLALYALALTSMAEKIRLYKRYALYLGPSHGKKNYKLIAFNHPRDLNAAVVFAKAWHERRRVLDGCAPY